MNSFKFRDVGFTDLKKLGDNQIILIAGKWKAQKEKEGNEMRRGSMVR